MPERYEGETVEEQIAKIMERLSGLESAAQSGAPIDLEKALVVSSVIDRPDWLRDFSREAIVGALGVLAHPRPKAVEPKTDDPDSRN